MLKEVKMFTIECDNCGKDANEGTEYSCWNDERQMEDVAMEAGFIRHNNKHYCSDCHDYDSEDNLIISVDGINVEFEEVKPNQNELH